MATKGQDDPFDESLGNIDELLEEMYANGEWLQFKKTLRLIMQCDAACMLSFLMGESKRYKAYRHYEGWFYCTARQMEAETYTPQWQQNKLIRELKDKQFIETERRGIPPVRFIKVNFRLVHAKCKEKKTAWQADFDRRYPDASRNVANQQNSIVANQQQSEPAEPQQTSNKKTHNIKTEESRVARDDSPADAGSHRSNGSTRSSKHNVPKNTNKKAKRASHEDGLGVIEELEEFHVQCATKLWSALSIAKLMTDQMHSLPKWKATFKQKCAKGNHKLIKERLDFLIAHIKLVRHPFRYGIPQIQSASKFFIRFDDLGNFMENHERCEYCQGEEDTPSRVSKVINEDGTVRYTIKKGKGEED